MNTGKPAERGSDTLHVIEDGDGSESLPVGDGESEKRKASEDVQNGVPTSRTSFPSASHGSKCGDQEGEGQIRWTERWQTIGTLALVLITFAYTVFAGLQTVAIQGQLSQMQRESISSARPIVFIHLMTSDLYTYDSKFATNFTIVNQGRTPALHEGMDQSIFTGATAQQDVERFFQQSNPIGENLAVPGEVISYNTAYSRTLPKKQREILLHENDSIFFVARIQYSDLDGHQYTSDFCYRRLYSDSRGIYAYCYQHNNMN